MSVETLEAFEKIAAYVRDKNNKVSCLDLSGVTGLTAIGDIKKENGSDEYNLSFYTSGLVTFIGSPDITAIGYAFERNYNLVSVSGLENVTYARGAFYSCHSLSVVPNMPKATNLQCTFNDTAIKELRHDNAEILAIGDCASLEVIDCPKVNDLIGGAFNGSIRPLDNLEELHLTSEFFDEVHCWAFNGGLVIGQVTLYLNAEQEKNIEINTNGDDILWRPKNSAGATAVVKNGTTDYVSLKNFKAIYCGNKQIK